jgi:hypothetical protein
LEAFGKAVDFEMFRTDLDAVLRAFDHIAIPDQIVEVCWFRCPSST